MCMCELRHYSPLPRTQDVSDRIEKEAPTSPVVQALERSAQQVVRRDWMNTIGEELRQGGWGQPWRNSAVYIV